MRRFRLTSHARALPSAALAVALFCLSSPTSAGAPPLSPRFPHELLARLPLALLATPAFTPKPEIRALPASELEALSTRDPLAARPFANEIRAAAKKHHLDPLLVAAVVEVESNFVPNAVSPKGAVGLMQLMPVHFGVSGAPVDPVQNLEFGVRYLSQLERRFGELPIALAAYHAGPGAVERAGGEAPYRSTRGYVSQVLSAYGRYRSVAAPGEVDSVSAVGSVVSSAGESSVGAERAAGSVF